MALFRWLPHPTFISSELSWHLHTTPWGKYNHGLSWLLIKSHPQNSLLIQESPKKIISKLAEQSSSWQKPCRQLGWHSQVFYKKIVESLSLEMTRTFIEFSTGTSTTKPQCHIFYLVSEHKPVFFFIQQSHKRKLKQIMWSCFPNFFYPFPPKQTIKKHQQENYENSFWRFSF